ncbi:MAG: PP2C family serine/threonine-protein phosphatase [Oceanipulchritudo sp.]
MIKASFALSETGALRNENQDGFLLDTDRGLLAVADGLGGLPNGTQASQLTLEILHAKLAALPSMDIAQLIAEINEEARNFGFDLHTAGFGTTLTLIRILPRSSRLQLGHVGDSSAFLVSSGKVRQLTEEHTVAARMIATQFEEACDAIPPSAHHTLTQCIGQDLYIDPQISEFEIRPGDRIFLCSDGASKTLEEKELQECLLMGDSLEHICQSLTFRIEIAGSPDNYTIVAVEFA